MFYYIWLYKRQLCQKVYVERYMWVLPDVRPMIIQTCTSMKDQCKSSFFISSDKLTKV